MVEITNNKFSKKMPKSFVKCIFILVPFLILSLCLGIKGSAVAQEVQGSDKKKAILETSKENGFKLSAKAAHTLGVEIKSIDTNTNFSIPENALVHSLDILAVYRLRDGWYKLIPVQVTEKKDGILFVQSPLIRQDDQIVVRGIELLRAVEMEAFGGGE